MANRETREVELKFKAKGLEQTTTQVNKLKDTALVGATQATEKLSRGMSNLSASSGLAGATINSLGQGIGDIQYGFGAIANNISQVGSLFGMLVSKADGVKGAMKSLGQQLVGPMGIMFAFQLTIAAINYFTSRTDKAGKAIDKLASKSITDGVSELNTLKNMVNDTAVSMDDKAKAIERAAKKHKELQGAVVNGKVDMDKFNTSIDSVTASLMKQAKTAGIMELITEKYKELAQLQKEGISRGVKGTIMDVFFGVGAAVTQDTKDFIENVNKVKDEIAGLEGMLEVDDLFTDNKQGKKTASTPFDTPEKRQKYIESLKMDVENLQAELDAEDLALDFGLLGSKTDSTSYNSEEDVEYQNLLSKYELLGMTEYESELALINQKEELALLEAEKFEENEELKTAITEHYANKRLELAEKESEGEMTMMQKTTAGLRAASRIAGNMAGENKAMKIASTGIATSAGIMQAFADEKSPFFLKLLNAGVVATQGAKNIASIKATKIPFANNSAGSGASIQAPAFNVIGQSVQSGLANVEAAINQGNSQPVQAYVVESEITSQQQLNRTANNNSSI